MGAPSTASDTQFDAVLQVFDRDPSGSSRALRNYASLHPARFVLNARGALLTLPPCRALKCLTGMLTPAGVLQFLLEQYALSRQTAIALARKVLVFEPRFDAVLIEYIEDKDLADHCEQSVLSALDILDEISERDRLVMNILAFLKHPNPKLRSKAARMLGKRRPNAACMDNLIHEPDARVRANAVESLFEVRNDYSYNLFRTLSKDKNNRVAGNARLGLYLSGDTSSIGLIDELAFDSRANFRNTGAWVMSQTCDVRFSPSLGKLLTDPDENVRAQAFRSLGRLKTNLKQLEAKQPLEIAVLHRSSNDREHSLRVAIYNECGQPLKDIPGTRFSIRVDGNYIRQYSVRQCDAASNLNIAFVLSLPKENEDPIKAELEAALERCSRLRRRTDRWGVMKLTRNSFWARFGQPSDHAAVAERDSGLLYASTTGQIKTMLRERPIFLNGLPDDEALQPVARDLLTTDLSSGPPDLVFIGEPPKSSLLNALFKRRQSLRFRVHALLYSGAECPRLLELIETSEGLLRHADEGNMARALEELYSCLIHRYELIWNDGGREIDLRVETKDTRGVLTAPLDSL